MYDISKLDPQIQRELKYSKDLDWVNAGRGGKSKRTGDPVVVWDAESGTSDHGAGTQSRVYHSSPYCRVIRSDISGSNVDLNYTTTYQGIKYTVEEFIVRFNVKIITRSIGGTASAEDTPEARFWCRLRDKYKLIIFNSFGNEGFDGPSASFSALAAYYVSACGLNDSGVPVRKSYSSVGVENDFINFTGNLEGTSFSSPFTGGEAANIVGWYDDDMSHEELGQYMIWTCKDIVKGSTDQDGNGLPIMPSIQKKYMSFTVGSNKCQVDGDVITMDTIPANVNGTVFVPLRIVSEALGGEVQWDEESDTATIIDKNGTASTLDDVTIKLTLGSKIALVDDEDADKIFDEVQLLQAPYRDINGRTMVPLRFVAENFDCKVAWIQKWQKVMIMEA